MRKLKCSICNAEHSLTAENLAIMASDAIAEIQCSCGERIQARYLEGGKILTATVGHTVELLARQPKRLDDFPMLRGIGANNLEAEA